jgi:hypothetical protein
VSKAGHQNVKLFDDMWVRHALLVVAVLASVAYAGRTEWSCVPLNSSTLATGVVWQQMKCSGKGMPIIPSTLGPLIVNMVTVDLSTPGIRLVPVTASANASFLQPLNKMAESDGRNLLAGIVRAC